MEENKKIRSEVVEPGENTAAENDGKLTEENLEEVAGGIFTKRLQQYKRNPSKETSN